MRDYYLHARVIHRISRRLIARCRETLARRGAVQRRLRQDALADGLIVIDAQIHLAHPDGRAFREDPTRLMKVFWHCHRLGFELGVDVERAVEESLHLVDDEFRRSADVRDLFLSICRSWGRVTQTFREMHELGFLGRYLPEWDALTCLVQYDVYHKFTADQHSLLAVENLEALAPGQSAESEAAHVLNDVERPDLLMLGMLLHDIGKGRGHGHVAKGIPLSEELTQRIGLSPADADKVVFLVASHVTMSHIAQRRDIDDPKTVASLADICRTPERLRMLYLLTFADMRAVGPGVMTGWQAQILGELFRRSLARLTGGDRRAADARRRRGACVGGHAPGGGAAHGERAPRDAVGPLSRDDVAPAHRRASPPRGAPRRGRHRHGAVPSSRSGLLRARHRHPRRAGTLLAHCGHAGRARHQYPLRADQYARRRHRHRHVPGQ
jgi:[protein-PII] uridylyltransferase